MIECIGSLLVCYLYYVKLFMFWVCIIFLNVFSIFVCLDEVMEIWKSFLLFFFFNVENFVL